MVTNPFLRGAVVSPLAYLPVLFLSSNGFTDFAGNDDCVSFYGKKKKKVKQLVLSDKYPINFKGKIKKTLLEPSVSVWVHEIVYHHGSSQ